MKNLPWEDEHPVTDDSLHLWLQRQGVGCGISEWVGLRKAIYYCTLYILASVEQKEKHCDSWATSAGTLATGNCSLGVHFTLSSHQICHWLHPCFHPLSDLDTQSLQCRFYRVLKKHAGCAEAGEKMPEGNLGTDPKSDFSIFYGSQWRVLILRITAELLPSSTVFGLLQVYPK